MSFPGRLLKRSRFLNLMITYIIVDLIFSNGQFMKRQIDDFVVIFAKKNGYERKLGAN